MKQNRTIFSRRVFQYVLSVILISLGCVACSETEEAGLHPTNKAIQLVAYKPNDAGLTKAAAVKEEFEAGDLIHVSATFKYSDIPATTTTYACMKFDGTNWLPNDKGVDLNWPWNAVTADFTAYYIPNATSALTEGEVADLDFNKLSKWVTEKGSDPMRATYSDVPAGSAVYLQFNHMAMKLTFMNLNEDSEYHLSGEFASGLVIKKEADGKLTDGFTTENILLSNTAESGEVTFLLPEINETDKLKLANADYTPCHIITVPHTLALGKHYTLDVTKLEDNGYSDDFKEEAWNDGSEAIVDISGDINAYLQAIHDGKVYTYNNTKILVIRSEGGQSVVTQIRDVDFKDAEFTPWGVPSNITFNGNGYTVKSVNITKSVDDCAALFGKNAGTIKNLNLDGVKSDVVSDIKFIGAIAGENTGTIQHIKVKIDGSFAATINGDKDLYMGGLVGYNDGYIEDVTISGAFSIQGTNSGSGIAHIGGLVGQSSKKVSNCIIQSNAGSTVTALGTGPIRVGGFVGTIVGTVDGTVTNCSANMNVDATGGSGIVRAGGFAGYATGEGIEKCSSNSVVSINDATEASVGGLIGQLEDGSINNGHAAGSITVPGSIDTDKRSVGGLVGWLAYGEMNGSSIVNCSSVSTVQDAATDGGLVGRVARGNDYDITGNASCSIYNSFSINEATNFVENGKDVTVRNFHHNGKDNEGKDVTIDALNANANAGGGLPWINSPILYGDKLPYLKRK